MLLAAPGSHRVHETERCVEPAVHLSCPGQSFRNRHEPNQCVRHRLSISGGPLQDAQRVASDGEAEVVWPVPRTGILPRVRLALELVTHLSRQNSEIDYAEAEEREKSRVVPSYFELRIGGGKAAKRQGALLSERHCSQMTVLPVLGTQPPIRTKLGLSSLIHQNERSCHPRDAHRAVLGSFPHLSRKVVSKEPQNVLVLVHSMHFRVLDA